jgi:hypothetical protein
MGDESARRDGTRRCGDVVDSRLAHRDDILVSTLRQVVEAMGGELKVQAVFPDGEVRLTRYEKAPA